MFATEESVLYKSETGCFPRSEKFHDELMELTTKSTSQEETKPFCRSAKFWIAICVLFIGGAVGIAISTTLDDAATSQSQDPPGLSPTDYSAASSWPSTSPEIPIDQSDEYKNLPLEAPVYDPPSAEECEAISNGETVTPFQEDELHHSLKVFMDLELGGNVDYEAVVQELEEKMQSILMPIIVGCNTATIRRNLQGLPFEGKVTHHRHLKLSPYSIAGAHADVEMDRSACTTSDYSSCIVVIVNLDLSLKGLETPDDLIDMLLSIFGQREEIVGILEMSNSLAGLVMKTVELNTGTSFRMPPSTTPTISPTIVESTKPTIAPWTPPPTDHPTKLPTSAPSRYPTNVPSPLSSFIPTITDSSSPTFAPVIWPTTQDPTSTPTKASSNAPSADPSKAPSTIPSIGPSNGPSTVPSNAPSRIPSRVPSRVPSRIPSRVPTLRPSLSPSLVPSITASTNPTFSPVTWPTTGEPTRLPTPAPSQAPTVSPSAIPTGKPSRNPSSNPTEPPTSSPPTPGPSVPPTSDPSATLSSSPTTTPSVPPTPLPTSLPTTTPPTLAPSILPTLAPSINPPPVPTRAPTMAPSERPSTSSSPTVGRPLRIACSGDSLTLGTFGRQPWDSTYPYQLQQMLGDRFQVYNYGKNSVTALRGLSYSYVNTPQFQASLNVQPDIYLLMLGSNDVKYWGSHGHNFQGDMVWIINQVRSIAMESPARIIVAIPPWVKSDNYGIRNDLLVSNVQPVVRSIATLENVQLVDMYSVTYNQGDSYLGDGVHLSRKGNRDLATAWKAAIQCNQNGICETGERCDTCPADCSC